MRSVARVGVLSVLPMAMIGGAAFAWAAQTAGPTPRDEGSRAVVASSTIDGLRVALRVGHQRYPADALIPTQLTMKNVSRHPIYIYGNGCFREPWVQVLDRRGNPYPAPAFTQSAECPYAPPAEIAPKAVMRVSPLVVLESGRIRPEVIVSSSRGPNRDVTGKILNLHLTPVPAPRVIVVREGAAGKGTGFSARVAGRWKHTGPLYAETFQSCRQATGAGTATGSLYWHTVAGSTMRTTILGPWCHSQLWHFLAGWIGHPIISFRVAVPKGSQPRY